MKPSQELIKAVIWSKRENPTFWNLFGEWVAANLLEAMTGTLTVPKREDELKHWACIGRQMSFTELKDLVDNAEKKVVKK
jgi:hypothetical protein